MLLEKYAHGTPVAFDLFLRRNFTRKCLDTYFRPSILMPSILMPSILRPSILSTDWFGDCMKSNSRNVKLSKRPFQLVESTKLDKPARVSFRVNEYHGDHRSLLYMSKKLINQYFFHQIRIIIFTLTVP